LTNQDFSIEITCGLRVCYTLYLATRMLHVLLMFKVLPW
jgi:hypothetical protein